MDVPFAIDLQDKVVVMTGAGGAICSAFARALNGCGAKLALLDLRLEAAEALAAEINQAGGNARAYQCNVLERDSLELAHEKILAELGSCDILINGAGGNNARANTDNEFFMPGDLDRDIKTFFDLDKAGVEFVFNLNFLGSLIPSQVFVRDMLGKENCSIINISSMNAYTPLTKIPAYSGAKAAISNFTQWLAVHFSRVGIRVNAIAPGFFIGEQNRDLLFNKDGTPTERAGKILNNTPMGRFGEIDELAGTLLYLLSPQAAGFVTGVVIPVDGGFSAYRGV